MLNQTYNYEKIKDLVLLIHKDSLKFNIIITGAGFSFLNWLLMCEGASNTILKVTIPYNKEILKKLIFKHQVPENELKFVSKIISSKLAKFAKEETKEIKSSDSSNIFGISCNGSISTNYPKKGDHHAWVSIYGKHKNLPQKNQTINMHIKLEKGLRNREEEDKIISYAIIKLLLVFNSPTFKIQDIDYAKFLDIKLSENEVINISRIQETE
ncbi:MAG: hypothetical protein CL764_01745 [Chloroflexi bacterium]|nr:hypothetical protein [Chloroflexota bacterium]|tara:strand:+ start:15795 stop:16430 length:636 start_codon:yes stop_codon:yes gene_type:complete